MIQDEVTLGVKIQSYEPLGSDFIRKETKLANPRVGKSLGIGEGLQTKAMCETWHNASFNSISRLGQ